MSRLADNKVFRGTLIIVSVGILAKLTSFIAEAVLAAYLGTTYQSDAYYLVSGIQSVVYPMLSVGVWKVFLPLYKEKMAQGLFEEAEALANKAITFFSVISFIFVGLLVVFANIVVSVVAPGFVGETKSLCVRLVRIAAPMYFFIITAAIFASMLQANNKFFGSQIREVASHIPTIIAAVLFYQYFGIESMAVALVVGGAARLLIELPFVDWGYTFKPDVKLNTPEFSLLLKRLPSALISEGVTQCNVLIDKSMASVLPEGTVSSLNYGHKLTNVFSGLLSSAISTALYPQMIELIALKRKDELADHLTKVLCIFCVLMLPVSLACVLYRYELVSVVFERGVFGKESVSSTAGVFSIYSIALFFISSNSVISNLFYGFGDTKTPMHISVANLIINIVLDVVLIQVWGINGLALATSLSSIVTFFIRLKAASQYIHIDSKRLTETALKVSVAALLACLPFRVYFCFYPTIKLAVLFLAALLGIPVYFAISTKLKVDGIEELTTAFREFINERTNVDK